jgi:hypothetical protein
MTFGGSMDTIFLFVVVVLFAVSCWLVAAIARLGRIE